MNSPEAGQRMSVSPEHGQAGPCAVVPQPHDAVAAALGRRQESRTAVKRQRRNLQTEGGGNQSVHVVNYPSLQI